MDTVDGFILTRHWRDMPSGTVVDFWLATDQGAKLMRRSDVVSVQPQIAFRAVSQTASQVRVDKGSQLRF
jgi:DNA polymerase-2